MEEFIKDTINASGNEILLEAYDKGWALKDEGDEKNGSLEISGVVSAYIN